MPSVEMTSIARETGVSPPLEEVASRVLAHFCAVFERQLDSDRALALREVEEPA